jgi:pimeloyl-ACP methyl ester carboxylesterase
MDAVTARGHRIAFERRGEGPPLILLHGYVGDRRMWRPAGISGSRLVVIPGAGHVCNIDAPERFNSELRAFLGSAPAD